MRQELCISTKGKKSTGQLSTISNMAISTSQYTAETNLTHIPRIYSVQHKYHAGSKSIRSITICNYYGLTNPMQNMDLCSKNIMYRTTQDMWHWLHFQGLVRKHLWGAYSKLLSNTQRLINKLDIAQGLTKITTLNFVVLNQLRFTVELSVFLSTFYTKTTGFTSLQIWNDDRRPLKTDSLLWANSQEKHQKWHEHPWAWLSHKTERLERSTNWQSSSAQLVEILSVACELWQTCTGQLSVAGDLAFGLVGRW